MKWTKLRTASVVGICVLLAGGVANGATQQAIMEISNANTGTTVIALPPDVRQELVKQKAAMRAIYLEFTETSRGSLANWDYSATSVYTGYFAGSRFYRQEQLPPGYEHYKNEVAFDGKTIWRRDTSEVSECPLADAPALLPPRLVRWPYLDAAGIYAPEYIAELGRISSLEPLALHYLEHGEPAKVEAVGGKLRITFQVGDEMANAQETALKNLRKDLQGKAPSKRDAAELEDLTGQKALKPTRAVVLLLDPKHGYGIAEREEWNVAGQRTGRIQSEDWIFYKDAGLWLPNRCVASYYARPRFFVSEYSELPIHFVTNELKRVEFGEKAIPFTFDQTKPGNHIFDRTTPATPLSTSISSAAREKVDVAAVERIKTEVLQHSQVMDIASWLSDVYGPRLTGSPNTQAAAGWAAATMRSWGLSNVHLESWGAYPRGWTSERFAFRAVAPRPFMINAVPAVWSVGTEGRVTGPAIRFDVHSFADMQRYAGKLHGAFLLIDPARPTPAHFEPLATRLSDARLAALAAPEPPPRLASNQVVELRYTDKIMGDPAARRWLMNEGAAAMLFNSSGDGGTIFIWGNGGSAWVNKNEPNQLPIVKVSVESYGRILRMLERNIPVTLELDMQNTFNDNPNVFNIIAEIPGTDPKLKDEVVMMGAHFDSWSYATGATDNAAGSAMLMEAMRILKALDLQPRRTIRIALWTGEEQGALGSAAYVAQHYRDSKGKSSATTSEYDTFSVYFNLDGGTGKIRGLFESGNTVPSQIFDAWMEPFKEIGMKTVSPWDIGGGDDNSFRSVGLPSFSFAQDDIEYESRTHHSNADVYERIQPDDMKFNTAVLASFAWQASQRDAKFPR
ncbi:MAG TPA: M20/M25/M40 family metallo-hydrolase [Verrucomicrobiae bacterium]